MARWLTFEWAAAWTLDNDIKVTEIVLMWDGFDAGCWISNQALSLLLVATGGARGSTRDYPS